MFPLSPKPLDMVNERSRSQWTLSVPLPLAVCRIVLFVCREISFVVPNVGQHVYPTCLWRTKFFFPTFSAVEWFTVLGSPVGSCGLSLNHGGSPNW